MVVLSRAAIVKAGRLIMHSWPVSEFGRNALSASPQRKQGFLQSPVVVRFEVAPMGR